MRVVSWEGGKGGKDGKVVRQQGCRGWRAVTWQIGKGWGEGWGVVKRWQSGNGVRIVRWQGGKGGRMMKRQGGRFLVLFKSGGHRVSPRFHHFSSFFFFSNGTKEQDRLKIIWHGQRDGRTLLRSNTSC